MMDLPFPEPKRILQLYEREKQAQFKHMTPQARLEWLAWINRLYWAGVISRQNKKRQRKKAA